MAYTSQNTTPSGSQSPLSSGDEALHMNPSSLDAVADDDSSSTHGTPSRSPTSLPRTQNAGKGGCWTCRVRRKKCDEQREGDSCKTCKRLTIKCLGWGPKRPDWMRDKKNVDAYKASIKAQLSRAGLIRGQPRHNPIQIPPQRATSQRSTGSNGNAAGSSAPTSVSVNRAEFDPFHPEPTFSANTLLVSGIAGSSSTSFDTLAPTSYDVFDQPSFHYQPNLAGSSSASFHTLAPDPLSEQTYGLFHTTANEHLGFLEPPSGLPFSHTAVHEELVMHYFSNVRKVQFILAGEALSEVTYSAVIGEPRGAVTLAVCALADLHSKQMRVSQGLEAPNHTPENSSTTYLLNEALFKLESNKATNGSWSEQDAIAAVHLVSLSQLSGGASDWDTPFGILCQWLLQTNLHLAENPWMSFLSLSSVSQLIVKATLWLDVFASLSVLHPPKFLPLWQRLLGEQSNYWSTGHDIDINQRMRMDLLTGCPDEAMLAIAEISNLAHWKASQLRNSCLSYPELIRRGTAIEQKLRRSPDQTSASNDTSPSGLPSPGGAALPTQDERSFIAKIFRETACLYLHTVLSNSTPGVPEVTSSVDVIVRLFSQLAPSDLDRALVFPICLAGCMTNDSSRRDFMKNRIRVLNESYGNLLQTRRLMEAVWQKRDVGGKEVDVRETIREQGLKLLLI